MACDLTNYERIIPCGIQVEGRGVCKVSDFNAAATVVEVTSAFKRAFSKVFDVDLVSASVTELDLLLEQNYPDIGCAVLDAKI